MTECHLTNILVLKIPETVEIIVIKVHQPCIDYRVPLTSNLSNPTSRWTCLNDKTRVMHVVNRLVVNFISCLSFWINVGYLKLIMVSIYLKIIAIYLYTISKVFLLDE